MPPSNKKQKLAAGDKFPSKQFDGIRGSRPYGGWWITLKEAQERSVGEEKWWIYQSRNGAVIDASQHFQSGSPNPSKPVWLYENGDMFIGEWKRDSSSNRMMENGIGTNYTHRDEKLKGGVHHGQYKEGRINGKGVDFFLPSSDLWSKNHLPGSVIKRDPNNKRSRGIPFRYEGVYHDGKEHDERGVATLKDGTTRVGPWVYGEPLGGWYSHSLIAAAPQRNPSRNGNQQSSAGPVKKEPRDVDDDAGDAGGRGDDASARSHSSVANALRNHARDGHQDITAAAAAVQSESNNGTDGNNNDLVAHAPGDGHQDIPAAAAVQSEPNNGTDGNNNDSMASAALRNHPRDGREDSPAATAQIKIEPSSDEPTHAVAIKQEANRVDETHTDEEEEIVVETDQDRRLKRIRDWISQDVIGNDPSPATVDQYARRLYQKGFQNVEMIKARLKDRHVNSFTWMLELHKEIFLERVEEGW